ncbi:MAG: acyl-[Paludibacteraceae bacterium]|nr:acyl-[acyl-carrier-protein]--UDP-N-acetylglucosamine O-acyltransferase [Paludibacteraceae bacterium]
GSVLVHQFSHIGAHVIIQGGSRVGKDVPPYVTAGRDPLAYVGLNIVGLRRRGYTKEQIGDIQNIYRLLYQSGLNTTQAMMKIEEEIPESVEKEAVVSFLKLSERGLIRGYFE